MEIGYINKKRLLKVAFLFSSCFFVPFVFKKQLALSQNILQITLSISLNPHLLPEPIVDKRYNFAESYFELHACSIP